MSIPISPLIIEAAAAAAVRFTQNALDILSFFLITIPVFGILFDKFISLEELGLSLNANRFHFILIGVALQFIRLVIDWSQTDCFEIEERMQKVKEAVLRPRFYFSMTRHTRLLPSRFFFQYPIFYVGLSTKFVDSIWGLFSVKESRIELEYPDPEARPVASWFTLFHLHPRHFMNSGVGFDCKARGFLRRKGIDDSIYPHVYLITAPHCLFFSFNPVTYYYVYTESYQLAYTILEVKNTFGEAHAYLLPRGNSKTTDSDYTYSCEFEKDFHISPFNKREGSYEVGVLDPISSGRFDIRIGILQTDRKKRMVVHTFSKGASLDLLKAGMYDIARIILHWSLTGFLVIPRTLRESWRYYRTGGADIHFRPEPISNTKARPATSLEEQCQTLALHFLQGCVNHSRYPVTLNISLPRFDVAVPPVTFILTTSNTQTQSHPEISLKILSHHFWQLLLASGDPSKLLDDIFKMDQEMRPIALSNWKAFRELLDANKSTYTPIEQDLLAPGHSIRNHISRVLLYPTLNIFFRITSQSLEDGSIYHFYRYRSCLTTLPPKPLQSSGDLKHSYSRTHTQDTTPKDFNAYISVMAQITVQLSIQTCCRKFIELWRSHGYNVDWIPSQ